MFPENPDPIGDMQCVLSVRSSIPFLVESRKFPMNFSEHLYFTDEEVGEYINIPSTMKGDYEYNIFLKRMEVSEMGDLMVFRISSEEYPEMQIFRELVKIPSVVIDYKYVEGGNHKTIFSFHHSHALDVSRFIFKLRKTFGNGIPEYFGPNRGFSFILEKAGKAEKIVAGVLSMKAPMAESDQMRGLFASRWIRRARYTAGGSTNDFLYRVADPEGINKKMFQRISGKENIYRATTASDISIFYSKRVFEHFSPMFYQYHEFDGNNLRICGLASESYERIIMEIVYGAVKEFPQLDIKMTYAAQVSPTSNGVHQTIIS